MQTTDTKTDLYNLSSDLRDLWQKAEAQYRDGNRDPESFFVGEDRRKLESLGLNPMDVYDYVEDFVGRGEPNFGDFLLITAERVLYFFDEMNGVPSEARISEESLPPKKEAVDGIEWLPRILAKAKGKLRGELPHEIMYGCGGDRKFLREHGIHPAAFLRKVSRSSDEEVVRFVKQASS